MSDLHLKPRRALEPKNMSFGMLAAERETAALRTYFHESEAYRLLRDGRKSVVLGHRGAGKTAIFKMLAEHYRSKNAAVIEIAPEEYSYELLSSTITSEYRGGWAKHGAYAAAWKYILYALAMKACASRPGLKTGSARRIYEYVRDNFIFDANPIGALISYLKRLEGIKLGKLEAGIKARELHRLYKLEELAPLLQSLDEISRTSCPVVILIDELDRGWDASEDAKAFVSGLFQAATAISVTTPNVRALISLRRELYDSIPALYDDAQKFRDVIQVIRWQKEELFEMISKRISHCFPQLEDRVPQQRWAALFAEEPGADTACSFEYIVDRTLLRPREVIQFCNDIHAVAVSSNTRYPLDRVAITKAEPGYSQDRIQDISAEYRFQFPGLETVMESFRGGAYTMTCEDLEVHCLSIITGDVGVAESARSWISSMVPEELVSVLWQVGFLRAEVAGGVRGAATVQGQFVGSNEAFSSILKNAPRFEIHPMFRRALSLKGESLGLGVSPVRPATL